MASKIVKTQNTIRQNDLYSYWVLQIPDQIFRPYPFNVFLMIQTRDDLIWDSIRSNLVVLPLATPRLI